MAVKVVLLVVLLASVCAAKCLGDVLENDAYTKMLLRNFEIEHAVLKVRLIRLGARTIQMKKLTCQSVVLIVNDADRIYSSIDAIMKALEYPPFVWVLLTKDGPCRKYFAFQPEIVSLADLRTREYQRRENPVRSQRGNPIRTKGRTEKCDGSKSLENRHIRVGTYNLAPFTYHEMQGNKTVWRGIEIDIFKAIAGSMNLTYEFLKAPENGFVIGSQKYTTAQMLEAREVDIAVSALVYSSERGQLFDPIWPDYFGSWVIVLPPPAVEYDLLSNVKPFEASVWLAIISSIVALSIIMWVWSKQLKMRDEFSLGLLYNLSLVVGQGGFNPRNLCGRFLLTGWNLGAIIIVFAYTSIMISFITAPIADFPVNNFEDIATKNGLKPVANKNVFLTAIIMQAKSGYEKELGDMFRKCPACLVTVDEDAAAMVLKGGYGFLTSEAMAKTTLVRDFLNTDKCRLAMLFPEDSFPISSGWYMSKDLKLLTKAFKIKIMKAIEGGVTRYIYRRHFREIPCYVLANLYPKYEESPLNVTQLQTGFALMGIGWLLAVIVFLFELLTKRS